MPLCVCMTPRHCMIPRHVMWQADNPGLWLFHCHIMWHQMMGQGLLFSENPQLTKAAPKDLPLCPTSCPAAAAPWLPSTVQALYGNTGFETGGR